MQTIRRAEDRGHANHGWLDSHHTFSFASYHDQAHMGFGALRVINEDRVQAGEGFPTHGHRDMEIISYVLEGGIAHKDSTGTGAVIKPGDVQRMSAGTGVMHSELNASKTEPVHFLQIWIEPAERGIKPGYEQKTFPDAEKRGKLRVVASPDGRDGSVRIYANASVYAGLFTAGEQASHPLAKGRRAWIHVARGSVQVGGQNVSAGDGVAVTGEDAVRVSGVQDGEILLFDLA